MRFKLKTKSGPEEGDERIVGGFLWFPKYIGREWRWLEHAKWLQIVRRLTQIVPDGGCYSPGQTYLSWCDAEWVNPPLAWCGVKIKKDDQGRFTRFNDKLWKVEKRYIRACSDGKIYEADHENTPDHRWTVCEETIDRVT